MNEKDLKELGLSSKRNKRLVDEATKAHYGTTVDTLIMVICNLSSGRPNTSDSDEIYAERRAVSDAENKAIHTETEGEGGIE